MWLETLVGTQIRIRSAHHRDPATPISRTQASDLATVFDLAAIAWEREQALASEITAGTPLGDAFELEAFLTQRSADPGANLGAHLARLNRAI